VTLPTRHFQISYENFMTSPASDAERFTLKDGDKVYIARISFPEGTRPPGFTQETLRRIASPAINIWGAIPSSLLNGSKLSLELKPLSNSKKEKTKSARGRKAKKKKSRLTGGRS